MAINHRPLANGQVRYEARLYNRPAGHSRTRRFDTREEAEKQIRDWEEIDRKRALPKTKIDVIPLWNRFNLGR